MIQWRLRRPGGRSVEIEECDASRWSYDPQPSDIIEEIIQQDQGSDEPRLRKRQAPEPQSEPPKSPASTLDRIIVSCEFATAELGDFSLMVGRSTDGYQLCVHRTGEARDTASYFTLANVPPATWIGLTDRYGQLLPICLRLADASSVEVVRAELTGDAPVLQPFNRGRTAG